MKPYKILVIDDYPNIVDILTIRLKANGYDVITAFDGITGLEKARTESPDLILLDVLLPKMDGFRICRLLKFDDKYKHIPIIMLTSRAREADRKTGLHMGADAYVYKPYEPVTLMQTISRCIENPACKTIAHDTIHQSAGVM